MSALCTVNDGTFGRKWWGSVARSVMVASSLDALAWPSPTLLEACLAAAPAPAPRLKCTEDRRSRARQPSGQSRMAYVGGPGAVRRRCGRARAVGQSEG